MTILKTSGSWSYLWEKRYPFNFNNRERSLPSPPSRDRNFMHVQVNSSKPIKAENQVSEGASRPHRLKTCKKTTWELSLPHPPPIEKISEACSMSQLKHSWCCKKFVYVYSLGLSRGKQSHWSKAMGKTKDSANLSVVISAETVCESLTLQDSLVQKTSRRRLTIPKRGFWYTCTLFAPQSYLTYLISIFAAK